LAILGDVIHKEMVLMRQGITGSLVKTTSALAISSSIMVEHLPFHSKAQGYGTAIVAGIIRKEMVKMWKTLGQWQ
jgi:hypothetical protein